MANNNDDPAWILLLLIGIVLFLGGMIWFFFHAQILDVLRYVRMAELALVAPIDHRAGLCLTWLRGAGVDVANPSQEQLVAAVGCFGLNDLRSLPQATRMDYINLSMTSLNAVSRISMNYLRWVVVAVGCFFIYRVLFVSKRDAFKTRHTLESFIRMQADMWPVTKPIVKFNPAKNSARIPGQMIPDKLPLFAEALSPEEWLSFHKIPVTGGIPDKDRTRRALLSQLGPRWRGEFNSLPPHMLGLLAAFALKGVQKRDESDEFLGRLSLCWSAEKGFRPTPEVMADIKKFLKDPEIGGQALAVAAKYAYRTTAIVGVLRWARFMGGVLAAAQFLWLRGVDRDLWYALNNLGRRSFHAEGAGAIAHYMAEEVAGKALPIPRLDTAIVSINKYLAANQPTIPPREVAGKARARV